MERGGGDSVGWGGALPGVRPRRTVSVTPYTEAIVLGQRPAQRPGASRTQRLLLPASVSHGAHTRTYTYEHKRSDGISRSGRGRAPLTPAHRHK